MTRATGSVRGGTYGGVSAQERVAQRRRRLLDAALEIVGTQGWSSATVRAICEQAKVGPRFFYESFPDTDELLGALHDELLDTALREALGAMAGARAELRARTEVSFQAMIRYLTEDPRRARVLFSEAYGSETLMRRRFAAMQTIAAAVLASSRELLDLPEEHERILNAVSLLVTGGVTELVLGWLNGGLGLDRDELITISVEFALTVGAVIDTMTRRVSPSVPPPITS
jgi:AcrR family transcriptional regulator